MTHLEYLQLETGPDRIQPNLATYFFDLGPDFVEGFSAFAYRVSDCHGATGGIEEPSQEDDEVFRSAIAIEDDENRPEGAPLRVRSSMPFLEPRYGDAYVVFVAPTPEED